MGRGQYAFFITPARPWPRILTPAEVAAIRSVIDLPRLRVLFDVMLYSGMRYADLRQVLAEPDRFDEERGRSTILTGGKKQRTVVLGMLYLAAHTDRLPFDDFLEAESEFRRSTRPTTPARASGASWPVT